MTDLLELRPDGWRFPSGHRHQWWTVLVGFKWKEGAQPTAIAVCSPLFRPCPRLTTRISELGAESDLPAGYTVDVLSAVVASHLDTVTDGCVTPVPGPYSCRASGWITDAITTEDRTRGTVRNRLIATLDLSLTVDLPPDDMPNVDAASILNIFHGVDPEHYGLVDDFLKINGLKPMEFRRAEEERP